MELLARTHGRHWAYKMRQQHDHYYYVDPEMMGRLRSIECKLDLILKKGNIQMAVLQDIITEVARTKGVAASVKVAVDGLKAKIEQLSADLAVAVAANDPVAMQAVVDELKAVNSELDALVPAIAANP